MTPRFGAVITTRAFPSVRAMLIAPVNSVSTRGGAQNWGAIVLRDEEAEVKYRWEIGSIVTLAPEGDHLVEITEGHE